MKVLQSVFSLNNSETHKIITILGIKLKIKRYLFERIFCTFLFKYSKIRNNKIVFINLMNWQYADNPKYILDEFLCKNDGNFEFVWIKNKLTNQSLIPHHPNLKVVDYESLSALRELMTAKIWVMNANPFLLLKKGLKKQKNTFFIQTWHGSMGIKKESADAGANAYKNLGWNKWQYLSSSLYDYIITGSGFENKILSSAFWGFGETLSFGNARDVVFYNDSKIYREKIKSIYNIPEENKILLYAPTWRNDKRCNCYNIDIKLLKRALKEKFNSDWTILIRPHIHMKKDIFAALYDKTEVINVAAYHDMQELLMAADILISDYSSCIPEYTILRKPSFIYATDMEKYENGFYYPLSTLPSPIATDNGELYSNIINFNYKKFIEDTESFLLKMEYKNDAFCCQRIYNFIKEKIEIGQ